VLIGVFIKYGEEKQLQQLRTKQECGWVVLKQLSFTHLSFGGVAHG
jgi:hypothetical protein